MASVATAQRAKADGVLLVAMDWQNYGRLLRIFNERPGIRLTYDRGDLEIMTLSYGHENVGHLLDRLIGIIALELNLDLASGGSTTLKRRKLERGLEPDECYWVRNANAIRGKEKIDIRRDPPPDLAIEVDVTSSSLDRMGIYAAFGVREVWRLKGPSISFFRLSPQGKYLPLARSKSFPILTSADLTRFIAQRKTDGEIEVMRRFQEWVRQRIGAKP